MIMADIGGNFFEAAGQKAVVTVSRKCDLQNVELAKRAAKALGAPFVLRGESPLAKIVEEAGVDFALVARDKMFYVYDAKTAGEFFFHPNMAHLRLKNLRLGFKDRMAEAMGLSPGMKVLDCTLGLGSDAIVASHIVGDGGAVTALEKNPLLALTVSHALKNFSTDNEPLKKAMRRIKVVCADYEDFLPNTAENSYDVVYFDPMFRRPLTKSAAMNALRPFSFCRALEKSAVDAAKRVARRRVVMKESAGSDEFARLGFGLTAGGKYSKVKYGAIDVL